MALESHAYYLAGDSYPADRHTEAALCDRLRRHLASLRTQEQWQGVPPGGNGSIAERLARLSAHLGAARDAVLIGRSSGARVASLHAARHPVRAAICIAFPFQSPNLVLEPERYAHLATTAAPTLILQGMEDDYGGAGLTECFPLSPAVQLHLLPGVGHDFRLSSAGWDAVTNLIRAFLDAPGAAPAPTQHSFDEADYLRRFPDVAKAAAAGEVASGWAHYHLHGRRESRRYRQIPLEGPFLAAAPDQAAV